MGPPLDEKVSASLTPTDPPTWPLGSGHGFTEKTIDADPASDVALPVASVPDPLPERFTATITTPPLELNTKVLRSTSIVLDPDVVDSESLSVVDGMSPVLGIVHADCPVPPAAIRNSMATVSRAMRGDPGPVVSGR